MNPVVSGAIKAALLATGWYAWRMRRASLPGVLTLCYHGVRSASWRHDEPAFSNLHVSSETFDGHCRVIAETCHPITLEWWREAAAGRRSLPDRPVLVTFDDGYRSVFETARHALRRFRIPAAVFVCSEPIQRQHLFWFDAVARRGGAAAVADTRNACFSDGHAFASSCLEPADPDDPLAPLTVDQVKALADEGFEIGVHTATHIPLAGAPPDRQRDELASCRDALQHWLRSPVNAVAYPWGHPGVDYTEETVGIVRELGFDVAFTTHPSFAGPREPALERSRFLVLAEVTASELAHRIAYAWR